MMVAKLTEQQKSLLQGVYCRGIEFFNPFQDGNNDWVITVEEVEACDIAWVKQLPLIEFTPKES